MKENLLTTRQAASFLGVSMAFLERDHWAGARIPFIKVSARTVRYRKSDVEAYLDAQMRRSTSDKGGSVS